MILEKEVAYFQKNKAKLLQQYLNQFVLIHEDQLIAPFATDAEAYAAGTNKFGNVPLLIKQVVLEEPTEQMPAYVLGLLSAPQ